LRRKRRMATKKSRRRAWRRQWVWKVGRVGA
jgi:hypothetical protein